MASFQELDAYLSREFSDDYWYDDAKFHTSNIIDRFTQEDWCTLGTCWQSRSKLWQIRCAEVIDYGDARQAFPILLDMIRQEDDELTLAAADSLRSIAMTEMDFSIGKDVLGRLRAVADTGNIAKLIVAQFENIGLELD